MDQQILALQVLVLQALDLRVQAQQVLVLQAQPYVIIVSVVHIIIALHMAVQNVKILMKTRSIQQRNFIQNVLKKIIL